MSSRLFADPSAATARGQDGRRRSSHCRSRALLAAALVAGISGPVPLIAQGAGNGFLFKQPVGSFAVHAGYAMANAGSQVFSDATDLLTLSKRDFDGFAYGGDISYTIAPRVDLVFGGEFSAASANSEYRDLVEGDNIPIRQATKFKRMPLGVGVKYYIADRGRSISRFAWIPNRYAPYVGVGGGAMWYRFRQDGDFVDFNSPSLDIFTAEVQSSGWAPMAQGMAGLDYTVGNWIALTFEGRYSYAKARLDPNAFEGFDKIDLSGFAGTVGFRVRF